MTTLANETTLALYRRMRKAAIETKRRRATDYDRRPFHAEQDRRDEALEWPVRL
jgi:hypothetical protein